MSLIKFSAVNNISGALLTENEQSIFQGYDLLTNTVAKSVQLNTTGDVKNVYDLMNNTWLNLRQNSTFIQFDETNGYSFRYDMLIRLQLSTLISSSATISVELGTKQINGGVVYGGIELTNFATNWGANITTTVKHVTLGTNDLKILVRANSFLALVSPVTTATTLNLLQHNAQFNYKSSLNIQLVQLLTTGV